MEQTSLTSVKLEPGDILDFASQMSSSNLSIKEEVHDEGSQQEQIWIPADIYEHVYEIENAPMTSVTTNQIYGNNIKNENMEYQVEDGSVVIGGEQRKLVGIGSAVEKGLQYRVKQEFGTQPPQQNFITINTHQGDVVYDQQIAVGEKKSQDIQNFPPSDSPLNYPGNDTTPNDNACGPVSLPDGHLMESPAMYQDSEGFYNASVSYPCQEFSMDTDAIQTQGIKRKLVSDEGTSENSSNKTSVLDRIESIITSNNKIVQIVNSNDLQSNKPKESSNKRTIVLWKCNYCSITFTSEEKLRKHSESCQNFVTVDSESNIETVPITLLTCEKCFISFDSQGNFDLHKEFHSNYPNAIYCKSCFQLLSSTDDLIIHLESDKDCAGEYSLEQRLKAFQNYHRIILVDEKTQIEESGCSSSEIVIPDMDVSLNGNQPDYVQDSSSSSGVNAVAPYVTHTSSDSEICVIEYSDINDKESTTQNTMQKTFTTTQNVEMIQTSLLGNNATSSSEKSNENIPKVSDKNLDKTSLSDRIDQLINKNKKIMNDTKIASKYPNQQRSEPKKRVVSLEEVISQRIESIINKNNKILNSTQVKKSRSETVKDFAIDNECSECQVKFPSATALKKHNKFTVHGEIKKCPHCDCLFRNSYFYHQHMKNEHKLCIVCDESFKNISALNAHSVAHEAGKIEFYLCNYCSNEYKNMKLLTEHLKNEHGIIPSVTFHFEKIKKYSTEETIIPQIKSTCNLCHKLFVDRNCLIDHMSTVHSTKKH